MQINNFDIYSIINKSSSKDRIIIYFDEILNMSILCKRKFSDTEFEALSKSFKTNNEANLFNVALQRTMYWLLTIVEVEKEILKVEYFATHLRSYFLTVDDKFLINTMISGTSKDLQKNRNTADKKQIKAAFKIMSDRINQLCFIGFGDNIIKKFVDGLNNQEKEEGDQDYYTEKFTKFFTDQMAYNTNNASEFLKQLKSNYAEFEIKFEVVENKIRDLESKLEKHKLFQEKLSEVDV